MASTHQFLTHQQECRISLHLNGLSSLQRYGIVIYVNIYVGVYTVYALLKKDLI